MQLGMPSCDPWFLAQGFTHSHAQLHQGHVRRVGMKPHRCKVLKSFQCGHPQSSKTALSFLRTMLYIRTHVALHQPEFAAKVSSTFLLWREGREWFFGTPDAFIWKKTIESMDFIRHHREKYPTRFPTHQQKNKNTSNSCWFSCQF